MYIVLVLFIYFPLISSECNYTSEWFNENHPWDSGSKGSDIERFALIRAKYSSIFEMSRWTGSFEIRIASYQNVTNTTILIQNYTQIYDGFICHAVDGQQCIDYEIRFCLEYNMCSITMNPPNINQTIGGHEARPHSLPWHVSIQYDNQHICSGILIDNQHILTAASCFRQNLVPIPYSVVLGSHYLSNATDRISMKRFIFHSDYNDVTSANNIALIKLSQRIQSFSDRIRPACLAHSNQQPNALNPLLTAGWRKVKNDTWSVSTTNELQQAFLTVMDECSHVYKKYDNENQLCIGTKGFNHALCQGDHGSGLYEKRKYDVDRWILTGILSYGCEYAPIGYPGVYVRLSAYHEWIQQTIERINK